MTVRLTHIDGKLPNLALMRLSAWHKNRGDTVIFSKFIEPELSEPRYDRIYGSAIFRFSENAIAHFKRTWPQGILGGTGTDSSATVEGIIGDFKGLDYTLYPWFRPSLGFTQRGCRLKCSFCVVPKKEGKIRHEQTIQELWRGEPHPKQIHLLDNDFFGQQDWLNRSEEIIEGKFQVCFSQGINVRLITAGASEVLARMDYRDDQFKRKRIYTAWDNKKDEAIFLKGIRLLMNAGIKPGHIMVYMLCGYWPNETIEDVMYRFETMKSIGLLPYPMVYDNTNRVMKLFQKWVVMRYHEFVTWEQFQKGYRPKLQNQTEFAI